MKFDNLIGTDVEKVGDIQSNTVSIDTNNINFIVTILSSNLYSNPIPSFIRETVSNAWDSHVEAGVSDPVIIELSKDTEGNYFCRIKDFGVGLSEERFNKIYKNIGSSTKRDSNNQIGGFGIGRFSALAYTNMVTITSNYNGTQYIYAMYKDNNQLNIDLLHKQTTSERNGLEVKVNIKYSDLQSFQQAIASQLVYFENLYVINTINPSFSEQFNNIKIKRFNNFSVNSSYHPTPQIDLILGKVKYPLRITSLTKNYSTQIYHYPISLNFNIGDLEVTPNREEVLYNTKNINKIQEVLDKAMGEIGSLIELSKKKDHKDLSSYLTAINTDDKLCLMSKEECGNNNNPVYIPIGKRTFTHTFEGIYYNPGSFSFIYNMISSVPIKINYKNARGKLVHDLEGYKDIDSIVRNPEYYGIGHVGQLKPITKSYLRDTYAIDHQISYYFKPLNFIEFYRIILRRLIYKPYYDIKIIRRICQYLVECYNKIKVVDDSIVTNEWLTERSNKLKLARQNKSKTNWKEFINVRHLRVSERDSSQTTHSNIKVRIEELVKNKILHVYDSYDSERLRTIQLLFPKRYTQTKTKLIEVAPSKMHLLEGLENFVNIEDFMDIYKYKAVRRFATAYYIKREIPHLGDLASISNLSMISTRLSKVVSTLHTYVVKWSNQFITEEDPVIEDMLGLCQENNYYDEEMKAILDSNKKDLMNAKVVTLFTSGYKEIQEDQINVLTDYIISRKLFIPSLEAVNRLKEQTIFNVVPEIQEEEEELTEITIIEDDENN